jgi:hypothetical protein
LFVRADGAPIRFAPANRMYSEMIAGIATYLARAQLRSGRVIDLRLLVCDAANRSR